MKKPANKVSVSSLCSFFESAYVSSRALHGYKFLHPNPNRLFFLNRDPNRTGESYPEPGRFAGH